MNSSTTRSLSALSSACSSGASEGDSLDTRLMQTIKESKFARGPKFILFNDGRFQRELVESHNEVRRRHAAPPLLWSTQLSETATEWATKLLDKGRMLYMDLPDTGENIRLSKASDSNHLPTGRETTTEWANEGAAFDFARPRWRSGCEHFSQLVWRESAEMGASRVWAPGKNLVAVVVLYRPAGNSNQPGAFATNVRGPGTPAANDLPSSLPNLHCPAPSSQSTPRHLGHKKPFLPTPAHLLYSHPRPFSAASSPASHTARRLPLHSSVSTASQPPPSQPHPP